MADKKITQLTNITGANLVDADEFVVVDISADETKAITLGELKEAFDSGSGFVRITGDTMTGDLTVPNVIVSGNVDGRDVSADGTKLDGIEAGADVTDTANVTAAGAAMETGAAFTGDVTFGDNDKAIFGAGSDLQIYHDGANSYIQNVTNSLIIQNDSDDKQVIIKSDNGSGGVADYFRANGTTGEALLYHYGSSKLATTSTGIDVTGTVTADGLTVDGVIQTVGGGSAGAVAIGVGDTDSGLYRSAFNEVRISAGGKGVAGFFNSGDISFYEDTGTTAKFFWDASAESLGIGTTSPSTNYETALHLNAPSFVNLHLTTDSTGTTGSDGFNLVTSSSSTSLINQEATPLIFSTSATERMRIDSSGNVGIGTTSPVSKLSIQSPSGQNALLEIAANGNTLGSTSALYGQDAVGNAFAWQRLNGPLLFGTNNTERMRIDSSGNLLVGQSSSTAPASGNVIGAAISPLGYISTNRTSVAAEFGTQGDGDIVVFRKDGSTVGVIGAGSGSDMYHGSGDTGLKYYNAGDAIHPYNPSTLANRDNAIDLGMSSIRFDDIYATNGTIQTSDRNEKQDIEALSDAEQRVAVACKGLLRKFRWIDAVAEKGDDARIHFGIIAQDLQDAFAAEGLDAGRYAMFISSTWTDEETGEERTRMGVRYPELLAFIIAAI